MRLPALLTVPTAHPVVAAVCSEANCCWSFSLGVASCAVCVLWAIENWPMLEMLTSITQWPAVSLLPPAVSNLKNKTKNSCSQVQVDVFIFSIFQWKCLPQFHEKKKVIFTIWNFAEKVIALTTRRSYLENPWLWFLLGNNLSFKKKKFSVLVWRIVFSSIFRMAVSRRWGVT